MCQRKTSLVPGEFFHVYNRGNSKQIIFFDDDDRDRFIKLLYLSNSQKNINFRDEIVDKKIDVWDFEKGDNIISIGAWVLMPNHFHLFLTSPTPGVGEEEKEKYEENITLFMRKLCISYSKYFNKKYDRAGSLFEGRFKSVHIKDDIQSKYLFSYIHLNPVKLINPTWKKAGIQKQKIDYTFRYLSGYKWSSYIDYCGIKRREKKILSPEDFPQYFSDKESLNSELIEWLKV